MFIRWDNIVVAGLKSLVYVVGTFITICLFCFQPVGNIGLACEKYFVKPVLNFEY